MGALFVKNQMANKQQHATTMGSLYQIVVDCVHIYNVHGSYAIRFYLSAKHASNLFSPIYFYFSYSTTNYRLSDYSINKYNVSTCRLQLKVSDVQNCSILFLIRTIYMCNFNFQIKIELLN